jgi:hypothetical protein
MKMFLIILKEDQGGQDWWSKWNIGGVVIYIYIYIWGLVGKSEGNKPL